MIVRLHTFLSFLCAHLPTTFIQVDDTRPVFLLPTVVGRQRIYRGVKDLPPHIRSDFRNAYMRLVIREVFNSNEPWLNPDLPMLQRIYDSVYPAYPARIRPSDAVFHPVNSNTT